MKKADFAVMLLTSGQHIIVTNRNCHYNPTRWFTENGVIYIQSRLFGDTPIQHPTIKSLLELRDCFVKLANEGCTFEF